jgi:SSS family solute:Na+ symporter
MVQRTVLAWNRTEDIPPLGCDRIMKTFTVSTIDVVILIGYVVGVRVFFGWLVSKRIRGKGSEGYFLGGRRLTWPLIGLSF